jgi:hypothetical protein
MIRKVGEQAPDLNPVKINNSEDNIKQLKDNFQELKKEMSSFTKEIPTFLIILPFCLSASFKVSSLTAKVSASLMFLVLTSLRPGNEFFH